MQSTLISPSKGRRLGRPLVRVLAAGSIYLGDKRAGKNDGNWSCLTQLIVALQFAPNAMTPENHVERS